MEQGAAVLAARTLADSLVLAEALTHSAARELGTIAPGRAHNGRRARSSDQREGFARRHDRAAERVPCDRGPRAQRAEQYRPRRSLPRARAHRRSDEAASERCIRLAVRLRGPAGARCQQRREPAHARGCRCDRAQTAAWRTGLDVQRTPAARCGTSQPAGNAKIMITQKSEPPNNPTMQQRSAPSSKPTSEPSDAPSSKPCSCEGRTEFAGAVAAPWP